MTITIARFACAILAWSVVLGSGACDKSALGGPADPPREPPEQPRFAHAATVRYHMHEHFDDLRRIEQMLVGGHLDDAKARAFMLTKAESDSGMAPWATEARGVVDAARWLAAARDLDDALRREARVAAACAECHFRTQRIPVFRRLSQPPSDQATPAARMARHQWAVDRLWEGMVGGNDELWRGGLEVLAAAPLPFSRITGAPALACHLQAQARRALANRMTDSLDERATAYGEMLVTCAACHATVDANKPMSGGYWNEPL